MFRPLKSRSLAWLALAPALFAAACSGAESPASSADQPATHGVLNIYSARHYDSDKALYDAFEAETGIKVRAREAGAAQLLETMKAEGDASPADVILASDAGTLWRFQDAGLTQPVQSDALEAAIPARLRDPDGNWFGLAKRFRTIVYDINAVEPGEVDEFVDLATARFEGEICVRSSSNIYNLSLLSELIERNGEEAAADWAGAIVDNFARDPAGGDTEQIRAVAAGACTVAIANHYYWVRLASSGAQADRETASTTALSFASAGNGAHVNVTAGAVAANSPNRENAVAFLEFLASPVGQAMLVTETKEYPVTAGVPLPEGLMELPADLSESDLPLDVLGRNQITAQQIYDRAGWP
ncbi:MAG: extracellular solute-binding protein [Hyphomonadaceae bacterium]|nr:extracellular solute-binding protein [Hyphomonadaceae bacterium]